jgi:hypothetical protein
VWLGYLAGWRYGDFDACFRFGQLGYELIERKGLRRFEGYVCLMFSSLMMPWAKHVLTCRPVIDRTFEVCHNTGRSYLGSCEPQHSALQPAVGGRSTR